MILKTKLCDGHNKSSIFTTHTAKQQASMLHDVQLFMKTITPRDNFVINCQTTQTWQRIINYKPLAV